MIKSSENISIRKIRKIYSEQQSAIHNRLTAFARIKPSEYFYELAYCLLTPQSSAVNSDKVITILKEKKFEIRDIDPELILRSKDCYIRFHKNKSSYLITLKNQFPFIAEHISKISSSTELRQWLVMNVRGLGWKESSHFLRNIGFRNLAILDRHILRNLLRFRVIYELPNTLTAKNYLKIEEKFLKFSKRVRIPMDELDLLFWSIETGEILK